MVSVPVLTFRSPLMVTSSFSRTVTLAPSVIASTAARSSSSVVMSYSASAAAAITGSSSTSASSARTVFSVFFMLFSLFLFFIFCPQGGSCLCANTRKPHGASDISILAPFCPQCQYPCVIFCINFPLIFVHHAIFGTHPAKKHPRKPQPSGDFPNFSVIPLP